MSIVKVNPFEVYGQLLSNQFQNILNMPSFNKFTALSPEELVLIGQTTIECFTKLGDLSELYIKKTNDVNVSVNICEKLSKMYTLHNELLSLIVKFSSISDDVAKNIKENAKENLSHDTMNYIHFNTVNKYKTIILQIIDCIRKLNVYSSILKDKV